MRREDWPRRRFLTAAAMAPLLGACSSSSSQAPPGDPGGTTAAPAPSAPVASTGAEEVWRWESAADPGRLDTATWTAMDYGGNRDLNEQHFNDPEMVEVDQGRLVLHAQPGERDGYPFVAGGVTSKGKRWIEPYGRLRTRQLLGPGVGLGVGVCLYGTDIDEVGWPACGEIDATEVALARPQSPFASIHGPGYSGGMPISATGSFPSLVDRWAEHELEWEPGQLTWRIDGRPYHVARADDARAGGGWPFGGPFFITIVMTVGSSLSGPVDLSTWSRDPGGTPRAYAVFEPPTFEVMKGSR